MEPPHGANSLEAFPYTGSRLAFGFTSLPFQDPSPMPLKTLLAGAGAWKFGGGCISTVLIFLVIMWALGGC